MNKMIKYLVVPLSIITILFLGFNFYRLNKLNEIEKNNYSVSINNKKHILPSAFETLIFLNQIGFQWKNLIEINKEYEYKSKSKLALNLGMRMTDGAVLLFSKSYLKTMFSRNVVLDLANELEVSEDIRESVLNLDSIVLLGGSVVDKLDRFAELENSVEHSLKSKNEESLAILVDIGGWVEGLYVITKGLRENHDPQIAEIIQNSRIIDLYIKTLLSESSKNIELEEKNLLNNIISNLEKIHKIMNSNSNIQLDKEKIIQIYEIIESLKLNIERRD